jgi:phytoene dehydrogenase-like protein
LLETSALSPLEFVYREFEHPAVRAALLFFNGLREVDLRSPGFGHHTAALMASKRMAQMCLGGSKRLADALVAAITEAGGAICLGAGPKRIVVQNQRAAGVETAAGEMFAARLAVVSGLNPQQTFLELIGEPHLPREWMERARKYRYNLLAPLFALHVNLREPPQYQAMQQHAELANALMIIAGIDDADRFSDIVRHHESGTIPPTVMWGSCPSQFDPRQAPAGQHTAFMWEKLPFRLHGSAKNWDAVGQEHGRAMLDTWNRRAPNVQPALIDWFVRTPLDIQRTLPNMHDGDLLVGALSHGQVGFHRPFPGAGHYRGHLPGLYLCGSCCHPGGNITGLPGYNAAQVILADLDIPAPWAPPPIAEILSG